MKRYQKTIIAVIVLVSVAVGFYFVGYKTAMEGLEEVQALRVFRQKFMVT